MPARRTAARKTSERPQARSLATRRKILDVAQPHIAKHGYGPSTMGDLAERAGVSTGTVYYHFPDKRTLLLALLDEWGDHQIQESRGGVPAALAAPNADLRTALAAFLAQKSKEMQSRGGLRLVFLEMAERDSEVAARLARIDQLATERLRDLIAFAQTRGIVRSTLDPLGAAFLVRRLLRSAAVDVFVHGVAEPSVETIERELVDLVYHYLTAR